MAKQVFIHARLSRAYLALARLSYSDERDTKFGNFVREEVCEAVSKEVYAW